MRISKKRIFGFGGLRARFFFPIVVAGLAGCASSAIKDGNYTMTKNDLVQIQVDWIKDKGTKFDVEMKVTDISKHDIIFLLREMSCFKGETRGVLEHTFFNTGERTIDFHSGQLKQFRMVCDIGTKSEGEFRFVIGKIYDNPGGNGETKGDVLAENIEWKGHH
jgi:hypothetical protein